MLPTQVFVAPGDASQFWPICNDKFRTDYLPPARLKVLIRSFGRVDSIRFDGAESFVCLVLRLRKETDDCFGKVTDISDEGNGPIPSESYAACGSMNQH